MEQPTYKNYVDSLLTTRALKKIYEVLEKKIS